MQVGTEFPISVKYAMSVIKFNPIRIVVTPPRVHLMLRLALRARRTRDGDALTYRVYPRATIWSRTVVRGAPAIEPL